MFARHIAHKSLLVNWLTNRPPLSTQKADLATRHLANSRTVFLRLLEISRSLDDDKLDREACPLVLQLILCQDAFD